MSETNFFGLSVGHYDPFANVSQPLVVPERPVVRPPSAPPPRQEGAVVDVVTNRLEPKPVFRPRLDLAPRPESTPIAEPAPELEVTPVAPELPSPIIPIDDLLNDFVEPKSKIKKAVKPKKAKPKLTHKIAERRKAKANSKAEKKAAPDLGQTNESDFTAQVLTAAADVGSVAVTPAPLVMDGGETAVAESETTFPRIAFEVKITKKQVFALIRTIITVAILAVSGYLVWDTWLVNKAVTGTFSSPAAAIVIDQASPSDVDITSISNQAWAAYSVPADQARYIYLPSVNIQARVMSVGVNSRGRIDSAKNVNDVAWYDGSAKPGQEGQVLISGSASFAPTYKAAFDNLSKLQVGDKITIERGDGKTISYRVVDTETVSADKVDMKKILSVPDKAIRGLTLMGCTGNYDYRTQSSDKRVIIYTVQE